MTNNNISDFIQGLYLSTQSYGLRSNWMKDKENHRFKYVANKIALCNYPIDYCGNRGNYVVELDGVPQEATKAEKLLLAQAYKSLTDSETSVIKFDFEFLAREERNKNG